MRINIYVLACLTMISAFTGCCQKNEKGYGNYNADKYFPDTSDMFKVQYTQADKPYVKMGPALYCPHSRVESYLDGNLYHYQIMGDSTALEFIPVFSNTKSYIYCDSKYKLLETFDNITFENRLCYTAVSYRDKSVPLEISQKTYFLNNENIILRKFTFRNNSSSAVKFSFIENPCFTLGDQYYTVYSPYISNLNFYRNAKTMDLKGYNGFNVTNTLNGKYKGCVLMGNTNPLLVWTRLDDFQNYISNNIEFKNEQTIGKACEESVAILKPDIELEPDKTKDIVVIYTAGFRSQNLNDSILKYVNIISGKFVQGYENKLQDQYKSYFTCKTDNTRVDALIAVCSKIVQNAAFELQNGKLFTLPGHMYPRFYSRDSYWHIMALLSLKQYDTAKKLIEYLYSYQYSDGSFPTRIDLTGNAQLHTDEPDIDSPMLAGLSLIGYVKSTNDMTSWNKYKGSIVRLLEFCEKRDTDKDGFLEQKGNQDWSDVGNRDGKVAYCQAIYHHFLKECAAIFEKDNPEIAGKCLSKSKIMEDKFENMFWDKEKGIYYDHIAADGTPCSVVSQDVCLAFVWGLAKNKEHIQKYLSVLKSKCWTPIGIATREPKVEKNYDPAGFYANGGSWLWESSFEALARMKQGDMDGAKQMLLKFQDYYFGNNPYHEFYFDCLEWYNPYNGNNCDYYYKCSRQFTTGPSALIWAVNEGIGKK